MHRPRPSEDLRFQAAMEPHRLAARLLPARPGSSCRRGIAPKRPPRTVPHLASLPEPPPGAASPPRGPQGRRACPLPLLPLSPLLPFCPAGQGPSSDSMDAGAPSLLAAGLRAITGFQESHIRGAHRGIVHACNEALLEKRGSFVACQSTRHMVPRCTPVTRPPARPRPCCRSSAAILSSSPQPSCGEYGQDRPSLTGAVTAYPALAYRSANCPSARIIQVVRSIAQLLHAHGGSSKIPCCPGNGDPLPDHSPSAGVTYPAVSLARSLMTGPLVADLYARSYGDLLFAQRLCLPHGSRHASHQSAMTVS